MFSRLTTAKVQPYIDAPSMHHITLGAPDNESILLGQVKCMKLPRTCRCRVVLVRKGRVRDATEAQVVPDVRNAFLAELGFTKPAKRLEESSLGFRDVEKLAQCEARLSEPNSSTSNTRTFQLEIPSYLPATTCHSGIEISYALVAICSLPDGQTIEAQQALRIIRKVSHDFYLQPSRNTTYPDCTLSMQIVFNEPTNEFSVDMPAMIRFDDLNLPSTILMHASDTRWMVPREIKWTIEETAVIISGHPDVSGHIPMSCAERQVRKREIGRGRKKLRLKYPFTQKGNTAVTIIDATGLEIPINIDIPQGMALGNATALSVAGGHVLHTVQMTDGASPNSRQMRFAVFLEYTLRVWIRIGEDTFKQDSGVLINRKIDEVAYTIVCPLEPAAETTGSRPGTPAIIIPPAYEASEDNTLPAYESIAR